MDFSPFGRWFVLVSPAVTNGRFSNNHLKKRRTQVRRMPLNRPFRGHFTCGVLLLPAQDPSTRELARMRLQVLRPRATF
jgi:hypothetical protein